MSEVTRQQLTDDYTSYRKPKKDDEPVRKPRTYCPRCKKYGRHKPGAKWERAHNGYVTGWCSRCIDIFDSAKGETIREKICIRDEQDSGSRQEDDAVRQSDVRGDYTPIQ